MQSNNFVVWGTIVVKSDAFSEHYLYLLVHLQSAEFKQIISFLKSPHPILSQLRCKNCT